MQTSVMIVGAGPTGLNLALRLARYRVPFRIVSCAAGPGEQSRAMVVQARTLEFYDQLGFAQEVVEQGIIAEMAHFRESDESGHAHDLAKFSFKEFGHGISPFPFVLAYAQDDHERFLIEKLNQSGCQVEWNTELIELRESDGKSDITLNCNGKVERALADYVCGCDGAHSRVREILGIGFPGGTYEQVFFVADVKIDRGFDRDFYITLGKHILALMFPVRLSGMQRLIGLVPPQLSGRDDLTFAHIRGQVEQLLAIRVEQVNWFSTYRVHHRVAEKFRAGRVFLLGDASHIHSPVGGQGMNTGIGDAVNLGWKLANVIQGRATQSLLDTYEVERIGFAKWLVSTTDRAFTPIASEGIGGEAVRRLLAPLMFSVAMRFTATRHALFRTVSQARIHYEASPLSEGKVGHVHGCDRLPWTGDEADADNFAPLRSAEWQLHVYGQVGTDLEMAARSLALPLHVFAWSTGAEDAGFQRDSAYLVRPDGYVAQALSKQDVNALNQFVARWRLRFGGGT